MTPGVGSCVQGRLVLCPGELESCMWCPPPRGQHLRAVPDGRPFAASCVAWGAWLPHEGCGSSETQ